MTDRLLQDDVAGALNYSTQLLANAQSNLNDRLQQLGILKQLQKPELAGQLQAVQRQAATNAMMSAQVATWMQANGFLPQAIVWLNQLPAGVQNQPVVRIALAECHLATGDWRAMRDFASKGHWGEWEFLRLAYMSRAWRGLGESMIADSEWNSATGLAGNQLGLLNALLELAGRWGIPASRRICSGGFSGGFPTPPGPSATWSSFILPPATRRCCISFTPNVSPFCRKIWNSKTTWPSPRCC